MNLILIKNYASIGASIATVVAELAVTITQFLLIKSEFKVGNVGNALSKKNVIRVIEILLKYEKFEYIIDMLENHVPKKWIKKVFAVLNDIFATLKCYATVYGKILIVTFSELFLSFAILKAIGFELNNIVFLAFIIAIVDILPVLGVGTVLIPWIIWEFTVGNTNLAVALGIVYIIILIIRQLIEPKLVSKQFGVHPLITLFAMYAGFKCRKICFNLRSF